MARKVVRSKKVDLFNYNAEDSSDDSDEVAELAVSLLPQEKGMLKKHPNIGPCLEILQELLNKLEKECRRADFKTFHEFLTRQLNPLFASSYNLQVQEFFGDFVASRNFGQLVRDYLLRVLEGCGKRTAVGLVLGKEDDASILFFNLRSCIVNFCNVSSTCALSVCGSRYVSDLVTEVEELSKVVKIKDKPQMYKVSHRPLDTCLGILLTCARPAESRNFYREAEVLRFLKLLLISPDDNTQREVLMILSSITDEDDSDELSPSIDSIRYFVEQLQKHLSEPVRCQSRYKTIDFCNTLCGLASVEENRPRIVECGALSPLVEILKRGSLEEKTSVAKTMRLLAFTESCRQKIWATEAAELLEKYKTSENKALRLASVQAMWEIEDSELVPMQRKLKQNPKMDLSEVSSLRMQEKLQRSSTKVISSRHVMISYHRNYRDMATRIYDALREAGHDVWFDVEEMGRDSETSLDKMSEGVEGAVAFLLCSSKGYFKSKNCKQEASYANKLNKPILPIKMEAGYAERGWLGVLINDKTYFDFTLEKSNKPFDHVISLLSEAIRKEIKKLS